MDFQKQIEKHAVEYFKNLHIEMPPEMIAKTISFFEFSLSKKGLVDTDDCEITHSKQLVVPIKWVIHMNSLASRIANIYGAKYIELVNHEKNPVYSFAFVGYKGDVHACYVSLKKLFKFTKDVRKAFVASRRKNMNPKNKEEKADDFMYDWIEEMETNLSPTALVGDNYDDLDKYIAENFNTEKEYNDCFISVAKFLKMITEASEKAIIGDLMKLFTKKYGKDLPMIQKRIEELKKHDLLVEQWSSL